MDYREYYSNRDVISLFSGAMGLDIGLGQAALLCYGECKGDYVCTAEACAAGKQVSKG